MGRWRSWSYIHIPLSLGASSKSKEDRVHQAQLACVLYTPASQNVAWLIDWISMIQLTPRASGCSSAGLPLLAACPRLLL